LFGDGAGSEEFAEDWRAEELSEALEDWGRGSARSHSAHTETGRESVERSNGRNIAGDVGWGVIGMKG
jgi:hypothetical protein